MHKERNKQTKKETVNYGEQTGNCQKGGGQQGIGEIKKIKSTLT